MKKSFIFGLFAAALALVSCNSTDGVDTSRKDGMSLNFFAMPPVEANSRAALTKDNEDLKFAYSVGDKVTVKNSENKSYEFTLEEGDKGFVCKDAKPTEKAAKWTAYFPSTTVSLADQTGTLADLAKYYLLMGTQDGITGAEGLDIKMNAQCAVLVIDNQKGDIDINVKSGATSWVDAIITDPNLGVGISTQSKEVSLLKTDKKDTYYVVVPAGKQIAIKDGDTVIKSTKEAGLTAGCYYNITVEEAPAAATTGTAKRKGDIDVNWVQLWENGPKFAVYNVGAANNKPEDYGGYYCWGKSTDKDGSKAYNKGTAVLSGTDDTAINLWGSNWRMPTQAELQALCYGDNCTKTWKTVNGVNGYEFKGKTGTAYENNSVFLPAAGRSLGSSVTLGGNRGFYWSSTPGSSLFAKYLDFNSDRALVGDDVRNYGFSVRAVLAE